MRELKAKKVCLICVNWTSTWALFGFFQASLQRDGKIYFLVYNYMQDPFNCKNCSDPSDLWWPQTPDTQLTGCVFVGHVRLFTNVVWDHLRESKKNRVLWFFLTCKGSRAEMGSERYSGELAPHSFGTEPDSWHSEDDL